MNRKFFAACAIAVVSIISIGASFQPRIGSVEMYPISCAATSCEIVPAEVGTTIVVLSVMFDVPGDTDVGFTTGTGSAVSGPNRFGGAGEPAGVNRAFEYGLFQANVGHSLRMTNSAAVEVTGDITIERR